MRIPFSGASVASRDSRAASIDAASHRQQHLLRPTRRRRFLSRVLGDPEVTAPRPVQPASSWNFVAMGAKTDNEPEPDLVEDIARAMRSTPLMRRLASVGAEFGEKPQTPIPVAPPPLAPSFSAQAIRRHEDSLTAIAASIGIAPASVGGSNLDEIKRRVEEAEAGWTMPPRSAEWLGKARREHRRAILRNAAAWVATLFIGGSIIVATALMLQR